MKLVNGETILITEPNRAVVTLKQFVFTPDRRELRRIAMDQIASHGPLSAGNAAQWFRRQALMEEDLGDLLSREPFEPFRIKLVNGDAHDVATPNNVTAS